MANGHRRETKCEGEMVSVIVEKTYQVMSIRPGERADATRESGFIVGLCGEYETFQVWVTKKEVKELKIGSKFVLTGFGESE